MAGGEGDPKEGTTSKVDSPSVIQNPTPGPGR